MRPAATLDEAVGRLVEVDRRTSADFSVVTLDGEVIGGADRPSTEWKLHQRAYAARPDVTTTAFPAGVAHHAGPG